MDTRDKLIGINLKRLIKARNFSQKNLAKAAKISETTLSRAVSGTQGLQPANLQSVLDALGATISDVTSNLSEKATPIDSRSIGDYVKALEVEIAELKTKNEVLSAELSKAKNDKTVDELATEVEKAKEAYAKIKKQFDEYQKQIDYDRKHQRFRSIKGPRSAG